MSDKRRKEGRIARKKGDGLFYFVAGTKVCAARSMGFDPVYTDSIIIVRHLPDKEERWNLKVQ